jgi:hypothetical protein
MSVPPNPSAAVTKLDAM